MAAGRGQILVPCPRPTWTRQRRPLQDAQTASKCVWSVREYTLSMTGASSYPTRHTSGHLSAHVPCTLQDNWWHTGKGEWAFQANLSNISSPQFSSSLSSLSSSSTRSRSSARHWRKSVELAAHSADWQARVWEASEGGWLAHLASNQQTGPRSGLRVVSVGCRGTRGLCTQGTHIRQDQLEECADCFDAEPTLLMN